VSDTPDGQQGDRIWERLRRRKVVQWGIACAAGAWGLLQGLQFLIDTYGWPVQLVRLSTLAFALGLPIAPVLAWYHGDRGERRVTRTELALVTPLFRTAESARPDPRAARDRSHLIFLVQGQGGRHRPQAQRRARP
jgi:hypothetical protein